RSTVTSPVATPTCTSACGRGRPEASFAEWPPVVLQVNQSLADGPIRGPEEGPLPVVGPIRRRVHPRTAPAFPGRAGDAALGRTAFASKPADDRVPGRAAVLARGEAAALIRT